MPYYETVFIARQDLTDNQVKDLTSTVEKIIKDQGGNIHKTEQWGLRTLAYRIRKNRKGHYVLIESEAPGSAIIELERVLRLNEDILRSMTTREDALSKGPSVMIEKPRDRDDRDKDNKRNEREAA